MDGHSKSQVKRLVTKSPEYAAGYQAGREAGLREASEIANREEDQFINASELTDSMGDQRHYSACASGAGSVAVAILSAIDK